jgi:hypothetical protein
MMDVGSRSTLWRRRLAGGFTLRNAAQHKNRRRDAGATKTVRSTRF